MRLEQNRMIELVREKPKVVNRIFGVPKQEQQRLVIDARNANNYCIDPEDPALPNLDDFTTLILNSEDMLFCAKSDLDSFYHRLCLPTWLRTYFGLHSLIRNGITMYPVGKTMPIG